jgi:hypothetical protein
LEFPVSTTQHSDPSDQSSVELLFVVLGERKAYNNYVTAQACRVLCIGMYFRLVLPQSRDVGLVIQACKVTDYNEDAVKFTCNEIEEPLL